MIRLHSVPLPNFLSVSREACHNTQLRPPISPPDQLAAVLEELEAKKVERGAILSSKAEELSRLFNELDDTLTAEQVDTSVCPPSYVLRRTRTA